MPYEHIKPLSDTWCNATISEGTLKNRDLILTFMSFLNENAEGLFHDVLNEWEDVVTALVNLDEGRDFEQETELCSHLFDVLDAIAPEGCIFGASESDGAHFGFWEFVDA